MAHSENRISKIKLPNNVIYDIHDSEALHGKELFWCTYGTTTYQEISDEIAAGHLPVVLYNNSICVYCRTASNFHMFTYTYLNYNYYVRVNTSNTWNAGSTYTQNINEKTTTLSSDSTNAQYPSAKVVYDAIEDVREIAQGRKTAYVVSSVTNPVFNTEDATIEVENDFTDVDGRTIALAGLHKGDVIYITETGIPDRWVGDNQAAIIPEGYTRLAYIEGTGTQYLDTGVIPTTTDMSMELDMMWTGDPSTLQTFESFGGFMAAGTTPRMGISKYSGKYMFGINTTSSPASPIPDNRRHVLRCYSDNAQQVLYVDGAPVYTTTVSSSALASNTSSIWFFARNSASANIAKMRLYRASIAVAGEIYDYIPCKNSNDEIGIYDLNHDTFFKSAVATPFTAGPVMTNAVQMYALDSQQLDLDSFYTKSQTNALLSEKQNLIDAQNPLPYSYLSGAPNLANVATSGSYNDLTNPPNFAAVATSGNYNDLSNTPTIPDVSNFVERSELASVATSGSYTDLTNKPTLITDVQKNGTSVVSNGVANVTVPTQTSDLTNNSGFITNATDSLQNYTLTSDLATVATSGDYDDLLNAPSLATVATTGDYNDLLNKPASELYYCTYGTTTSAQITAAITAGQLPVCVYSGNMDGWTNPVFVYCGQNATYMYLSFTTNRKAYIIRVTKSDDTWGFDYDAFEFQYYKRSSTAGWGGGNPANVSNNYYPSEKLTYDSIQEVRELAEGRKRAIVCSDVTNPALNSQNDTVTVATLRDINNQYYPAVDLNLGDTVYVSETDVPDRWVSNVEIDTSGITDVTGTTWTFKERIDLATYSSVIGKNIVSVTFTSNNVNCTGLNRIDNYTMHYTGKGGVYYNGWSYFDAEAFRVVTFTGGTDSANADFISWLKQNAILSSETYVATLSKLETAKVSVTDVQVNNTSVVNANGVAQISLADVATSGDYTDLTNTPVLADVATTGDYADLLNTPTIPDISTKVDKVTSTDNALVRFDGTGGAIQNNTHVTLDDNGNITTDKALILSGLTGSVSTGDSRLYFGNSTSDYKSYLASNTLGAFSLCSPNGNFVFYANVGGYNCLMTSCGADLGRNNNDGAYAWKDIFMKGSINRHKTGSSGWYTFNFPTKSGTFALLDDIPSVNYPVTSVNGQTGAVVLTIPTDLGDLTNNAGYLKLTDLATVASTGSYTDLINLPTLPQNLSDLGEDSTSIHVSQTQAAAWSAKQDALTFDDAPTEDSTNPVTSDGIYDALQDVREIAEGKRQTYVVSIEDNPNAGLDSQDDPVTIQNSLVDVDGNSITLASLAIGDSILITETDYPDRWVSSFADKVALADTDGSSTQSGTPSPEASVPITSSTYVDVSYHDVELRGIGTNVDTYTANSTTITRAIGVYTFTGTEAFDNGASATLANHRVFRNTSLFSSSYVPIMSAAVPFLCTHFTTEYTSTYTVANQLTRWMSGSTPSQQGMFCIAEETIGITSSATQSQAVAAFQSWLAAQYNNGNPVRIYYPMATQTTETLPLYNVGERTGAVLNTLETAKVPITSVSINGSTVTPVAGNVDITVPDTYLKSVTSVDKKTGNEVTSPSNILRITKQNDTTFDYEPNSLKFKDFSNNQEADENNKTINLNLAPYNQAGIWYTVASSVIAKMANAPGNVASGECMLEVRPLGSTRYTLQIFTWKAGGGFAVWQRVQNNTNVWGNWSPTAVSQMSTAAGTTISTSDTDYIATVTTNGQKLYRSTKKVSDFVGISNSQNINGTKTFTVDQIMSNNRSLKWTKTDSTTVAMLIMPSDNKFYIGNSGVDLYFNNSLLPASTYNLGSTTAKWNNIYASGAVYASTLNNGADITVPTTSGTLALLSDLSGFLTADTTALENYSTTNSFDDVAFSGSYNDLSDTPTIPTNSDYVDLTTTQSIGGQKTFTANRMYIKGETHFDAGGSPTDYAYGQAVGIYGKSMMCNTLYVGGFKYRTSAMNTAGKPATVWNLPNLDSGSTYTLATTSDLTNFITKSVNNLDNYTLTSALATVATSGAYSDLTGTPTIPTTTSQLTNNSGFITASDIPLVFEDYTIPTT